MKKKIKTHNLNYFIIIMIVIFSELTLLYLNTIGCGRRGSGTGPGIDSTTVLRISLQKSFSIATLCCENQIDPDSINILKKWDGDSIFFINKRLFGYDLYLDDTIGNSYGTTYTFNLISNLGKAEGTITFPEMAMFTYPSQYDTIPIGDITVTWVDCNGAEYYHLYKEITARDSVGNQIIIQDTVLLPNTPSITISASEFDVIGAAYYVVHLFVRPRAGVRQGTGESANMTGSILGYICADGDGDIMTFNVGIPVDVIEFSNTDFLKLNGKPDGKVVKVR